MRGMGTTGNFAAPRTLEELADCLARKGERTFVVAGGTDLAIALKEKKIFDFDLIDIFRLDGLRGVEEREGELCIGACTTAAELEKAPAVAKRLGALAAAASRLGSAQIRNRATVGGNAANASQSADLLTVLLACDARCEILNGKNERRTERLGEVVVGLGKTKLASDEVFARFFVPAPRGLSGFAKVGARKAVTIAKLNCCLLAEKRDGRMHDPAVWLGAVGPRPVRAPLIEAALEGAAFEGEAAHRIAEAVRRQVEALIPDRESRHYKKEAAIGVLEDAILDCFFREGSKEHE